MIYNKAVDVTPSDATNIVHPADRRLTDALYVGGAGVVAVVFDDNSVVNFTAVAGEILPLAAKRVNSTNTTGTLIRGCYSI